MNLYGYHELEQDLDHIKSLRMSMSELGTMGCSVLGKRYHTSGSERARFSFTSMQVCMRMSG